MARVFISHAHVDKELALKITALVRDALKLDNEDFFLSSEGGLGVAPAANIRDQVFTSLGNVSSLIVLVTPQSAGRPWVWLEAGHRLGRSDRSNPIFVVPSQRYVNVLLQPVSDMRCICLDNDGELLELVKAVAANLEETPAEVLFYKTSLDKLAAAARTDYSARAERRAQLITWANRRGVALVVTLIAFIGALYGYTLLRDARREVEAASQQVIQLQRDLSGANDVVNDEVSKTAARYLQLKGVVKWREQPVLGAHIVASLETNVPGDCAPPVCTRDDTTSEGEFLLDLTKIGALKDDDIVLHVTAPEFDTFSKRVKLDVRAIDSGVPAHTVSLTRARSAGR